MEANGQCHAPASLSPLPTKYEAGCVSETVLTRKTEKKMIPTPGIETLSLGERNVGRFMNLWRCLYINSMAPVCAVKCVVEERC